MSFYKSPMDAFSLTWSSVTNHARVLLCITRNPGIRRREIGDRAGTTERAAYNIVTEPEREPLVVRSLGEGDAERASTTAGRPDRCTRRVAPGA